MNGHEYMKRIRVVSRNIQLLTEQIEREYVLAAGVTAIQYDKDKVQTSPSADRMANIVDNMMEHMEELDKEVKKLRSLEEEARLLLLQLEDTHERVLALHYLHGKSWRMVAKMLKYNENYVYELKEKALEELTGVLKNFQKNKTSEKI